MKHFLQQMKREGKIEEVLKEGDKIIIDESKPTNGASNMPPPGRMF